ncbi:ferredoxin [Nocardia salmonicida]|uniref:ferredoxin n=1 Tax=Nocardia salmonicida TaxID=53431 RepID=UPI00378793BE
MELHLNRAHCVGHALCHTTDPDLFPIDDDGYSSLDSAVIDAADADRAQRGVAACPEQALRLEQ